MMRWKLSYLLVVLIVVALLTISVGSPKVAANGPLDGSIMDEAVFFVGFDAGLHKERSGFVVVDPRARRALVDQLPTGHLPTFFNQAVRQLLQVLQEAFYHWNLVEIMRNLS